MLPAWLIRGFWEYISKGVIPLGFGTPLLRFEEAHVRILTHRPILLIVPLFVRCVTAQYLPLLRVRMLWRRYTEVEGTYMASLYGEYSSLSARLPLSCSYVVHGHANVLLHSRCADGVVYIGTTFRSH